MDLAAARDAFTAAARASQDATLDHQADPADLDLLQRAVEARRRVLAALDRLVDAAGYHQVPAARVAALAAQRPALAADLAQAVELLAARA